MLKSLHEDELENRATAGDVSLVSGRGDRSLMAVILLVVAIAVTTAYFITWLLARPGAPFQVLDHPNERSLHNTPIPRTGGMGIWAGAFAGATLALTFLGIRPELPWIVGAALLVGTISFIDDRFHVPVAVRLIAHITAGGLLVFGDFGLEYLKLPGIELHISHAMGLFVSIAFIVWMTNLYNFMDGMDGLAGGMAVLGFGTLGLLGYVAGDGYFAALCWLIAAAAGGFLLVNFPPARIFMGDTGASVLGLFAAALSLLGDKSGLFPLWVAVLMFSPFIVDATVTLVGRAARGEKVWRAHKTHYYQRLVRAGWGHRKTVLWEYVLMAGCSISAVVGALVQTVEVKWALIGAWAAIYATFILLVGRLERRARRCDNPSI